MLILERRQLWTGGIGEKGRDKHFFIHRAPQLCYASPSGGAHKCTIPICTTPHTGIRLEQVSIPNACGLLYAFPFPLFLFLQVKWPTEVMTTDIKNAIWGIQTQQSIPWCVGAAQHDSTTNRFLSTAGCLPRSRLCWCMYKYRCRLCLWILRQERQGTLQPFWCCPSLWLHPIQ